MTFIDDAVVCSPTHTLLRFTRLVSTKWPDVNTMRPTIYAAVFLEARSKNKYNANLLGLSHLCAWTAQRASNVEARITRDCPIQHGTAPRRLCKIKYQVVESRSTQVRTIHECDTQLLYGASGPTVSEDGSCRANDTSALQSYVQMYALDTVQWRQTNNRDTDKELIPSKSAWDPTLFQQSSCHCRMTTVMRSHHISATR